MGISKKKKIKTISNEKSSKDCCSSLKVNLSCDSNLSDSGNESLNRTNAECQANAAVSKLKGNYCAESSTFGCFNGKRMFTNHNSVSNNIALKNVSIALDKISNNDIALNKQCETLKCAILTKTKQMFDKQDELSIRTCTVLNTKNNGLSKTINKNTYMIKEGNNATNLNKDIGSTPKDEYKNESAKHREKSRLRKRCLFMSEECSKSNNINRSNDDVNFKSYLSSSKDEHCNVSVMKSKLKSNTIMCVIAENYETDNLISSKDKSLSMSNILDKDIFVATPIACSTMISENDRIPDVEDKTCAQTKKNVLSCSNVCIKEDKIPMEITEVCGDFILNDKSKLSGTDVRKNIFENCLGKRTPNNHPIAFMEHALLQLNSKDKQPLHDLERDTNVQTNNVSVKTCSANTVQTSLNVNTSIDLINESKKSIDKCRQIRGRVACNDYGNHHHNNMNLTCTEEPQEGTNTVCTSLQMNTSVNASSMLPENNNKSKISEYFNDRNSKDNNVYIKLKNVNDRHREVINRIHGEEQSYIESTPYPTCRSVMLKSQLKQNAIGHSLGSNGQIKPHKEQEEIKHGTVITNGLSFEKCKEATNESNLEKGVKNVKKATDKKKCKKRLLPLRECSEISFSPVEKQCSPLQSSICRKQLKKKNKCKKVDENTTQCNARGEKKDCDKKKNQEKKPRKIISKKIVVKRIVNEDIFKKLQEERENVNKMQDTYIFSRNLSNDFQSVQRPSTIQLPKRKVHRINIVATGLSNEDKSIVKSIVKTLGSAKIESNVTKRTTHVVTTGVRTINLLHGIIRGCWLVSLEWVFKSLENNAWLNPEEYEMKHFSKAVLENRKDRQLFGSSYVPELFATCGYLYVDKNTTPPCNVLKDLVKTAGGCITENRETAKITIGMDGLKESWILDCITSGELQPYNQYQR